MAPARPPISTSSPGSCAPTSGEVFLRGERITRLSAPMRARRGLGRAFQLTNLFPDLSVLENVRLAVQARAGVGLNIFGLASDRVELTERAMGFLERVRLERRAKDAAAALGHGDQRKLEVAILLALEPELFMFDEPTAGMSVDEVPVILDLIEAIKAQYDKTILLVEHKMDVVRRLADRVIVLHQGALRGRRRARGGGGLADRAGGVSRRTAGQCLSGCCCNCKACTRISATTTSCMASISSCRRAS